MTDTSREAIELLVEYLRDQNFCVDWIMEARDTIIALAAERDAERAAKDKANRDSVAFAETLAKTLRIAGDLLAVIHRDGGHYQDEHGFEKAAEDAATKYREAIAAKETAERMLSVANEAVSRMDDALDIGPGSAEIARLRGQLETAERERDEAMAKRLVTLTGRELRAAIAFVCPDSDDEDQLATECCIQFCERENADGHYCWLAEYPEEGAVFLSEEPNAIRATGDGT